MKHLLFLYSEVMPYTLSVFRSLVNDFNCKVSVVHWDKKKRTPFSADSDNIDFYKRSELNASQIRDLVKEINPDLLFLSGRMDKAYLKTAKYAKKNGIPVVMGSDNQWKGNVKDWLKVLLSRFLYKPYFTHVWIPGDYQFELARRIGFPQDNIISNIYSANVDNFLGAEIQINEGQNKNRDILFVGRLHEVKGIDKLVKVLEGLKKDGLFKGTLWLYGNGPLENKIPDTNWIKKMGFSSQKEIMEGVENCSFFCLPSRGEPWGVVIHEMAAAGMPIVCSDVCGAASEFVIDGYNGFLFNSNLNNELKESITRMLELEEEELTKFGKRSRHLGQRITPEISAASLLSALD